LNAKGDIIRRLNEWGIKIPENIPTKKRPINSISENLNPSENLILVHNTFISQEDFDFINSNFKNTYFAICALSNEYIEKTLPPMKLIMQNTENICIGTDSYASNKSLSVLDELKFIQKHFDIGLADLLKWASLNGAKALKIDKQFGSIEVGKKPVLINITNIDFSEMKFTEDSRVSSI
jgi:cytosine/adenosine deaminase-related metal-dependent hydrolase